MAIEKVDLPIKNGGFSQLLGPDSNTSDTRRLASSPTSVPLWICHAEVLGNATVGDLGGLEWENQWEIHWDIWDIWDIYIYGDICHSGLHMGISGDIWRYMS
jgi:hypothetical protein